MFISIKSTNDSKNGRGGKRAPPDILGVSRGHGGKEHYPMLLAWLVVTATNALLSGKMDTRLSWIREQVYSALGLRDKDLFSELLSRDARRMEKQLLHALDQPSEKYSSALIFYTLVTDAEREVEVEEGKGYSTQSCPQA